MIKRVRQNRSLHPSNLQKFKGNNRGAIYSGTQSQDKATFKEFPKEHVDRLVNQIKEDSKQNRRKELTLLIVVIGFAGIFGIYSIISSTDYSKKPTLINYIAESPPIIWSGKRSDPLKVPFSNHFYAPFIGNMEFEVQVDRSYTLYNDKMVVENTTNILFFDHDCNLIGKLLPENGSITLMYVGPQKEGMGPKRIVYALAKEDTNDDGLVNNHDRHDLFISELDGKDLTRITERRVRSMRWIGNGNELQIEFANKAGKKDSLYGTYNTKTKMLQ